MVVGDDVALVGVAADDHAGAQSVGLVGRRPAAEVLAPVAVGRVDVDGDHRVEALGSHSLGQGGVLGVIDADGAAGSAGAAAEDVARRREPEDEGRDEHHAQGTCRAAGKGLAKDSGPGILGPLCTLLFACLAALLLVGGTLCCLRLLAGALGLGLCVTRAAGIHTRRRSCALGAAVRGVCRLLALFGAHALGGCGAGSVLAHVCLLSSSGCDPAFLFDI